MTKINSLKGLWWKAAPADFCIILYLSCSHPVTLSISHVICMRLPLGWRPLFLNDGRWIGLWGWGTCTADTAQGESSGLWSHRNRTFTLARAWGLGDGRSKNMRIFSHLIQILDTESSRAPLPSPYISVALLFRAFASFSEDSLLDIVNYLWALVV